MFHGPYPVADLLVKLAGQMLGQNCWSNSWVKFVRQIAGSNCWSNSRIKFTGQNHGSNRSIKFLDQIPRSNLLVKSAGQTQPIHGPPLASLGARMGAPTDSLKTGKDGREMGKEKPHASQRGVWWLAL